ncbi:tRNA uridine 5-carboxymethylaminomethyl modification enzyme MnmG [Bacteroidia bacterium]|nr:tRNA uridine 5-carboxymethylaminomethyl modification enzyme MnmG [Bacteroidia bacterium]
MTEIYDIVVIGGGHAGCEAAVAAARMGSRVLLVTMDMSKFGAMSCNPAVGGVAKGQIVREIDALGGQMGVIADRSTIQFRMLNRSKGPAMWSPRAQCDKHLFSQLWRETLERTSNLSLWQDEVIDIIVERGAVTGVVTRMGVRFGARAVILTTGTFLGGLMHVGRQNFPGGRAGDAASYGLTAKLRALGFESGRMKTGTPARLDGRSIDFSVMEPQYGDPNPSKFSFLPEVKPVGEQLPCFLVYTSSEVHDSLRRGFADSPLFNGTIQGVGPRYCPSIEDKLRTFADKEAHQLFLEPEGRTTNEYYLNGFSSSLPWEVQFEALRKIRGLEHVHVFRPGYAVEYDYFPPTQLRHTLETKLVEGLYFAGQINGTTGYEEAAAQGLIAGINAHLHCVEREPFILRRDEAYIGVLVDDLVSKGVDEPYRMFTSRAEHRILLRGDNADLRLTPKGHEIGLVDNHRFDVFVQKKTRSESLKNFLFDQSVAPDEINGHFFSINFAPIQQKKRLYTLLLRNEITLSGLIDAIPALAVHIADNDTAEDVIEAVEIEVKYRGYIERERMIADKLIRLENITLRPDFDYDAVSSLTIEARQKLSRIKPATIGQASRIPGVSPADINVLLVYFGR